MEMLGQQIFEVKLTSYHSLCLQLLSLVVLICDPVLTSPGSVTEALGQCWVFTSFLKAQWLCFSSVVYAQIGPYVLLLVEFTFLSYKNLLGNVDETICSVLK